MSDALTYTYAEACRVAGISDRTFRRHKAAGVFKGLLSPLPRRVIKAKWDAYVCGERTRYLTVPTFTQPAAR